MSDATPSTRGVLHSGAGPFLWALLFLAIFLAVFFLQKPSALVIENGTMKEIFTTYGVAVGPALALLAMLVMYLLAGIKRIIGLRRFKSLNAIVVLLVIAPLAAFGYQLQYREKPYTDIARGIIGLFGLPLLAAGIAVCALALVWFVVTLVRRP